MLPLQTKYVAATKGTLRNGHNGWTEDGMKRYNAFLLAVCFDRQANGEPFQARLHDYITKRNNTDGYDPASSRKRRFQDIDVQPVKILSEKDAAQIIQKKVQSGEDSSAIEEYGIAVFGQH